MNIFLIGFQWIFRYVADKSLADTLRPFLIQFLGQVTTLLSPQFWFELMKVDFIRFLVTGIRLHYFTNLEGGIRFHESEDQSIANNAVKWNLKALQEFTCLHDRIKTLFYAFMSVQSISKESRILVVGPRVEDDLLLLKAYGYHNFRGLDLMSYSPWVDVGDMHKMPYEDNSFDAVLLPWVLVYSKTPDIAAKEAIRVCKKNGIVGIGAEHYPNFNLEEHLEKGKNSEYFVDGKVINTAEEHLSLFGNSIGKIFFLHDMGEFIKDRMSNTAVLFSVNK